MNRIRDTFPRGCFDCGSMEIMTATITEVLICGACGSQYAVTRVGDLLVPLRVVQWTKIKDERR